MGVWKKVLAKLYSKWGLPSLIGRHRPNFWRNPKISAPIRWRIAWRLFWALKFLKKVIPSLSYGRSKFGPKSWYFLLRFYTICHFFWLSLFSLPLCTFLVISFQTPPQKSDGFLRGGYKYRHYFSIIMCEIIFYRRLRPELHWREFVEYFKPEPCGLH